MGFRLKIVLSGMLVIIVFATSIVLVFIPQARSFIIEQKKQTTREHVGFALTMIENYYNEVQMGKIDTEIAKSRAIYELAKFHFGNSESKSGFIVISKEGKLLADFNRSEKIGTNVFDMGDKNDKTQSIFALIENIARGKEVLRVNSGSFFRHRDKYRDSVKSSAEKISYVYIFEPWGWYVSAGVYLNDVQSDFGRLYISIAVLICILSALAIAVFMISSGAVSRPISTLTKSLEHLDLRTELNTKMEDETGRMVRYFNEFIYKIKDILIQIVDSTGQLAQSSREMSVLANRFADNTHAQNESAGLIGATIRNITGEMDLVTGEIDAEFESLNNLVTDMEELSQMINIVEAETSEAKKTIKAINNQAVSGDEALKKMNEIMQKSKRSSREITGIIKIINDISEQINLLSLNAAIEAARAGEKGRGFAVVADQISQLAEETSQSINAIRALILENEQEIIRGNDHTEETITRLSTIISGVSLLETMISGISDKMKMQVGTKENVAAVIKEIKEKSEGIRMASKVQKVAVFEINGHLEKITDGVKRNAQGSGDLSFATAQVAEMAQKLKEKVGIFKL